MTVAAGLDYQRPLTAPAARPRLHYGDPIRLIGTVAVIVGHVTDMAVFRWGEYGASVSKFDWWTCCVLDVASRWAVPLFVMLSGALLLDPTRGESPSQFYKRRFARVGIPTLFWSPVFMAFGVYYVGMRWGYNWPKMLTNLALGQPYPHMHFLFRIVGLYLFTPMLRVFVRHASRPMLIGTVILSFAMAGGHSVVMVLTGGQPNAFSRFVPFLGYYLAGYALRDVRLSGRGLMLAWAGFIATTALVSGATGQLLIHLGQSSPSTTGPGLLIDPIGAAYPVAHLGFEFLNPVRIIMGLCVWLIFQNTFTRPWPDRQPWRWLSRVGAPATLGIYIVHPLFREVMMLEDRNPIGPLWHSALIGVPVMTAIILALSTLLTVGLMKIPYVRRIVG